MNDQDNNVFQSDYWINEQFTADNAVRWLNKHRGEGYVFFISVSQRGRIEGKPDHYLPITGNVKVSLRTAQLFIVNAYTPTMTAKGARVCIRGLDNCVFIG